MSVRSKKYYSACKTKRVTPIEKARGYDAYPRAFFIRDRKKVTPSSRQEAAPTLGDAKNTGAVEDDGEG